MLFPLLSENVHRPRRFEENRNDISVPRVTFPDFGDTGKVIIGYCNFFKVGDDAVFMNALGNDRYATTSSPCDEDLSHISPDSLGDIDNDRVFGKLSPAFH